MLNRLREQMVFLLLAVVFAAAAHAQSPEYELTIGSIFLNRDAEYSDALIVDNAHAELVGASAVNTGYHGGLLTELQHNYAPGQSLGVRFFGLEDWTVQDSVNTTNGAWLRYTSTLGEGGITQVDTQFNSDLYSLEVNHTHQHNEWLSLLVGFRWLSIDESFHADFWQGPIDYSFYDGSVRNDLYGFQGGADVLLWNGNHVVIDSQFKAGVYGADVRYGGLYQNGIDAQILDGVERAAFVGEIGLNAHVYLSEHVIVSAGYQVLWVDGIGILGDQLRVANWVEGTGVGANGSAFYHGGILSMTFLH